MQQTIASEAVLRSQEYWRLNQEIESSGFIAEMDVSALAIAIGPDSDFASVKVTYYDPLKGGNSSRLKNIPVSVGNPFIGRIDAFNATQIPGSNIDGSKPTSAKLIITLEDLVDNTYQPYGVPLVDPPPVVRAIPKIDLISYVTDPRALLRERPPKQFNFDIVPQPGAGNDRTYFLVPYYGRRFARATIINQSGIGAAEQLDLIMRGVILNEGSGATPAANMSGQVDLGLARIPRNGTANLTTYAREDGVFDLLQVEVTNPANTPIPVGFLSLQIDVSDREG